MAEDSQFLPSFVRPIHYDIQLVPDLPKRQVHGEIDITVQIKKPTKTIKMHQLNLELNHETTIKIGERSYQVVGTQDDNKTQTVLFKFPEELPKCEEAVIHIKWTAELNKDMKGMYRTTYFDRKGKRHTTIATQFESTEARRCFPCFDEPKSKATFSVRLVMEARFHVLSNMPPDTEDNILPNVYPPMREWRFQKTPPMSTYLLGIVAGEWDRVERKTKSGVVVRAWSRLGQASEVEIPCDFAVRVLEFFEEYFDFPYPLPKLDMVPVENFSAGAMENWGVITYKTPYLQVNAGTSQDLMYDIKEVTAHEIAHMWFGNLVTPRYWDALWLKEGFATYFAFWVCDQLEPEEHWKVRYLQEDTLRGKKLDAQESTHALESPVATPGQVQETYDSISYCKGAALIKFVESYIGADALRTGLRAYIKQFAYKNAASLDLWLSLGKAATVTGPPLKDVMKDWVKAVGHPIIHVERTSPTQLKLSQKRFSATTSAQKWIIPIHITTSGKPKESTLFVLDAESATFEIDASTTWVVVNSQQRAFVCVRYETAELQEAILKNFAHFEEADRVGILADHVQLFKAKRINMKTLFEIFTAAAAKETSAAVFEVILNLFLDMMPLFDEDVATKQPLQKYARNLLAPVWKSWGLNSKDGEDRRITIVRSDLIKTLAMCDEKEVLLAAQELLESKGPEGIAVDVREGVWTAVMIKGHRPSHEALMKLIQTTTVDSDAMRACKAVQQSRNAADISSHFQMLLPSEDGKSSSLKGELLVDLCRGLTDSNAMARKAAWSFVSANWDALILAAGGPAQAKHIFKAFAGASDDNTARSIKDFAARLNADTKSHVGKTVEQVIEEIKTNQSLRASNANFLKTL